jgi:Mn2+/Fe2+ NRAMP family transporter
MKKLFSQIGPGIIVAATGIGAGDMIAAAASGAGFGLAIAWAAVIGALLKYYLNEGIARWQLVSGKTIVEGWNIHFPGIVNWYFIIYLFLWSFVVGGALSAACGLAANAIFPQLTVLSWGVIHALLAIVIVLFSNYNFLEIIMKFFIALMFLVIVITAILSVSDWSALGSSLLSFEIPSGSSKFVLGVIGGVGGSVTLLNYGYWIKQKGWNGADKLKRSRTDLIVAYVITGLFGVAVMIISAGLKPDVLQGSKMILAMADELEKVSGSVGRWIFLLGFWGAVFSSMIGVWQGVPFLFNDIIRQNTRYVSINKIMGVSVPYFLFLIYIAIPPLTLLLFGKPVWVVILYSVTGAFFMPFLAMLLLIMNNRIIKPQMKNSRITNIALITTLLLFLFLLVTELMDFFSF